MKTSRKEFLQVSLVLATGMGAVACSSDDDDDNNGTGGSSGNNNQTCNTTIETNHGHEMTVTEKQLTDAEPVIYDIHGTANHTHDVSLTAADFEALANGETVTVSSSVSESHFHVVDVSC